MDTSYGHHQRTSSQQVVDVVQHVTNSTTRTPAADILYNTTNGHHHQRTSSQQFYNKFATLQCQRPTSRHVKMLGCGKFLYVGGEFKFVVSSSVGGVRSRQDVVQQI